MSEEFKRIAKQELIEDITEIGNLLQTCLNDTNMHAKASDIEKHIHKIKGLAPMMGQEQIGQVAALLDKILKTSLGGTAVSGLYQTIANSHVFMKNAINDSAQNYDELIAQIKSDHKDIL